MLPGGAAVESRNREQAIRTTRELIANPDVTAIFEGAFEHQDVVVRVDLRQRRPNRCWRLIGVKSAADLKDYHLDDVAIQHRTVMGSGLNLGSSSLAHVNREYVYQGGPIDVHQFFKLRNLTPQVEEIQPEIATQLRTQFRVLAMAEPPEVAAGAHYGDPVNASSTTAAIHRFQTTTFGIYREFLPKRWRSWRQQASSRSTISRRTSHSPNGFGVRVRASSRASRGSATKCAMN